MLPSVTACQTQGQTLGPRFSFSAHSHSSGCVLGPLFGSSEGLGHRDGRSFPQGHGAGKPKPASHPLQLPGLWAPIPAQPRCPPLLRRPPRRALSEPTAPPRAHRVLERKDHESGTLIVPGVPPFAAGGGERSGKGMSPRLSPSHTGPARRELMARAQRGGERPNGTRRSHQDNPHLGGRGQFRNFGLFLLTCVEGPQD